MATLILDPSFSKLEGTILHKTFRSNCKELSLDRRDFSVQVRRLHIGSPGHYARVCHPERDLFCVEMNSNKFNLFDATSALGHEAVHMRQHLDGRLRDTPFGALWEGKIIPTHILEDRAHYDNLPWEKEAWAMQCNLHRAALCTLNREEFEACSPLLSNGLVSLWLEKEAA